LQDESKQNQKFTFPYLSDTNEPVIFEIMIDPRVSKLKRSDKKLVLICRNTGCSQP